MLLLNISTFLSVFLITTCHCEVQMGSYSKNDRRNSLVLIVYRDMGFKMCGRYCLYLKLCTAVNYNPVYLVCELLAGSAADTHVTVQDIIYSAIDTWSLTDDPCYPNPCSGNEKCAKTNRESYYCQEIIPKDCGDILVTGKGSGVYAINIDGTHGFKVYCDMETNGGGYTVFQNRYDGSVDFYNARTWANFKHGFGNLSGEFWLGLENIHQMTRKNEFMLRVDLEDHYGVKAYAEYTTFSVNSEADKYRLGIAGYSGTAGDFKDSGMLNDANMQFSTPDMNTFCTLRMKSGWWHEYCTHSNLNGVYNAGIFWYGFKQYTDLKKVSMKIKRK